MDASLKKNSIYNVIYKILNMLFPLISTSYLSHILHADGIGKVSYAQNIAQYFVMIAPLGIVNYGTRELARIRESKDKSKQLFSELVILNTISTIVCSLSYYILIQNCLFFSNEIILYRIVGLSIVLNLFNVEWYYQGKEEYAYIAIRSIVFKALSLVAILALVKAKEDYLTYAFIYVFGIAGNSLLNVIRLFREGVGFTFREIGLINHLKATLILLCSNIAIEVYVLFDTTMLGFMSNSNIVGYYTNSQRVLRIIVSLIGAINGVILPRLSYYHEQELQDKCNNLVSLVSMIIAFISVPCAVGIAITAKDIIIVLFGQSFTPAITTLRLGIPIVFVMGFSNLFGTQVLLTYRREKILLYSVLIGAFVNVIFNILLIPMFLQNGAIVASVLSETIVSIVTFVFASKHIMIRLERFFIIKELCALLIMSINVLIITYLFNTSAIKLVMEISVGALTYGISSYILKNPVICLIRGERIV